MEKICPGIFGILTLLLLLSGGFAPGWLVIDYSNISREIPVTFHIGLFYFYYVGNGTSNAISYSAAGDLSGSSFLTLGMLEYQIEVCIGIVTAFIGLVLTWVYSREKAPSMLVAPIIMYLIASAATWVAVGRFLSAVIIFAVSTNLCGVPYSIILSGLGGLFCFVLFIILIVMKIQHNRSPPQQGVVLSDIPITTVGYPQNQAYGQQSGYNVYSVPHQGNEYKMYSGSPPKV